TVWWRTYTNWKKREDSARKVPPKPSSSPRIGWRRDRRCFSISGSRPGSRARSLRRPRQHRRKVKPSNPGFVTRLGLGVANEGQGAARELLPPRPRFALICDRRSRPPSSRKEPNRRRAGVWRETRAGTPNASRAGEPAKLRPRNRVCRQPARERLQRTKEKRRSGVRPPGWPASWPLGSVNPARL